ncbi:MAG: hypothetical protein H6728_07090 [Myxococcales bacterium]|nr:hypothetical protein [Myxococcales bacterium]
MRRIYWCFWGVCWLLFALPFFSVQFPPIADLPQQVSQIRLFWEVGQSTSSAAYTIFWWFPNHLSYAFLGAGWWLGGPLGAGRWAMWLLAGFWLGGVFRLAWCVKRPAWQAALVGFSFFNFTMYWGFYSFLLGQAIFWWGLAWWLKAPEERTWKAELWGGLCWGILLYLSHVLWWGVALLSIGLASFRLGWRWRWRWIGLLPSLGLILFWRISFSQLEQSSYIHWGWPFYMRLFPSYFTHFSMGSLKGWGETLYIGGVFVLVVGGALLGRLGGNSVEAEEKWFDRRLLLCLFVLLGLALFFPTSFGRTIFFGERWVPSLLLLGALILRTSRRFEKIFSGVVLAGGVAFILWTSSVWGLVENYEYSGLGDALQKLPARPSVLGVDLGKRSRFLKIHRPFLQGFAYSQVLKGGLLYSSFAGHYSSLVVFQRGYKKPWADGAVWRPRFLTRDTFRYFSHVIVFAYDKQHNNFVARWGLEPLTQRGMWRLYRGLKKDRTPRKATSQETSKRAP